VAEPGHPRVWAAQARTQLERLREASQQMATWAKEFNLDKESAEEVEGACGDMLYACDRIQGVIDEYGG
jgi:hypothetical protein